MSIWYGDGPFDSGELSTEEAFLVRRQEGGISAFGGGAAVDSWGVAGNAAEIDAASSAVSDEDGVGWKQDTSSSINNEASLTSQINGIFRSATPIVRIKFSLVQLTDCRFFVGLINTISEVISNDNGGIGRYAGLQFSSVRGGGDTNFQFVSGDGIGGDQEITDSLVAADDEVYSLLVKLDTIAVVARMELLSKTGRSLRRILHDTTIPGASNGLRFGLGIETLAGAVKSHVFYHAPISVLGLEI